MDSHFDHPLRIGPFIYKVVRDSVSQGELEEEGAVGLAVPDSLVIHISNDLAPDRERATVLHEIIHACADLSGLDDNCTEEDWATRLGPLLLGVMRDNPHLVAWVMERG